MQRWGRQHSLGLFISVFALFTNAEAKTQFLRVKPKTTITHVYAKGYLRPATHLAGLTPLTVDADTLALWNFNTDSATSVIDSAPAPLNGTASNAPLAAIPNLDPVFANGRQFQADSDALVQFGATRGSKLDFDGFTSFSFEAVVSPVWPIIDSNGDGIPDIEGQDGIATLFDNGQLKVQLINQHLAAYVRGISGFKGLQTDTVLASNRPYRISVAFDHGILAIVLNDVVLGSVDTRISKIISSPLQNEMISLGHHFPGYLDDIRVSKTSRTDISAPVIRLVTPDPTQVQTTIRPTFQIDLSEAGTGIDPASVQVSLNSVPQFNLTVTSSTISGSMSTDLATGENELEIQAADLAGNYTYYHTVVVADIQTSSAVPTIVSLSGGSDTCAVAAPDGKVYCWGSNNVGQLLDGTTQNSLTPKLLPGLTDVLNTSVGLSHICAMMKDRTLKCWGTNQRGELGLGEVSPNPITSPTAVTYVLAARQVSAGLHHTCIVSENRQVLCWGGNESGQLGAGNTADSPYPAPVAGLTSVASVGAGDTFSCALLFSGFVRCWGNNSSGQLGDGSFLSRTTPSIVSGITDATQLSVGPSHACVRTRTGNIKCWGSNANGKLGVPESSPVNVPVVHPALSNITQVEAMEFSTCARNASNQIFCWGKNTNGQLGNGTLQNSETPVPVTQLDSVNFFATGRGNGCVIQNDSKLKCWGINQNGQVGVGNTTDQPTPVQVSIPLPNAPIEGHFVYLTAGEYEQCGVYSNGYSYCWGRGNFGAIGNGTFQDSYSPSYVVGGHSFTQLAIGTVDTCAVTSGKEVWCWGANGNGQLGPNVPVFSYSAVPVLIPNLSNVIALSASPETVCALLGDHTLRCWGDGYIGQLGNGTYIPSITPVQVTGIENAIRIAANSNAVHVCALLQTGQIKCWGANSHGQLGMDPKIIPSSSVPLIVPGISDAIDIMVNGESTCAILASHKIKCFGSNSEGQLGNGTKTDSSTPVEVLGMTDVTQLAMGTQTVCALRSSGETACWGRDLGRFASGITTGNPVPAWITSSLVSIHAGSNFICGLDQDQHVMCWGENSKGQFGRGNTLGSSYPQLMGF